MNSVLWKPKSISKDKRPVALCPLGPLGYSISVHMVPITSKKAKSLYHSSHRLHKLCLHQPLPTPCSSPTTWASCSSDAPSLWFPPLPCCPFLCSHLHPSPPSSGSLALCSTLLTFILYGKTCLCEWVTSISLSFSLSSYHDFFLHSCIDFEACSCSISFSALIFLGCFPCAYVSLSLFKSPPYEDSRHRKRAHPNVVWPYLNSITSAKTLFPNKESHIHRG